jgi:proteic killer suppression protein
MIKGFASRATESIWHGRRTAELPADLHSVALRKLRQLDAAVELNFLKVPPGNRLHRLTKDREGQHAIWVNSQYRLCFRWDGKDAHDVEITDYH